MAQWELRLHAYINAGFLDNGQISRAAINRLDQEDGSVAHVQSKTCAGVPVGDYLATARTVGANWPQIQGRTIDLETQNLIILLRGLPRLSLLQFLGKKLDLEPAVLLKHPSLPSTFHIRPLPSRPTQCITLPMVSLGTYGTSSPVRPMGQ